MVEKSKGKRVLEEDDEAAEPMQEKKPRFPKGKKAKREHGGPGPQPEPKEEEKDLDTVVDPQLAAKERAKRRSQIKEAELFHEHGDVSAAEVHYDDTAKFEDDGMKLEPFNLKQEREEGYFDANGNYVEYAIQNKIKDAWLDSAVVDSTYAEKHLKKEESDEEYHDLSTADIGKIKRNIANVLQPGETIIQALKRLKGTSGDTKKRMPEGTKRIFDQLTEDAMKLMENGEYNVYNEEREIFEQEAEGYERIARARAGLFSTEENDGGEDIFSDGPRNGEASSSILNRVLDQSEQKTSGDGGDDFDMFGDDEENTNPESSTSGIVSEVSQQIPQPASESLNSSQALNGGDATKGEESDFVYDPSSGYYYSSSLGYYYDPTSTLYCSAASGKWYSYNEQSGEYVEIPNDAAENDAAA